MIKTLRKKVILSTMIVTLILIILMGGIINGFYFLTLNLEADTMLQLVAE